MLVKPSLQRINDLTETSSIEQIYDVDKSYPQDLHDEPNDLPFYLTILYLRIKDE